MISIGVSSSQALWSPHDLNSIFSFTFPPNVFKNQGILGTEQQETS